MANVFESDARQLDARTARYVAGDGTDGPAYVAGADVWTPFQVFKLADGQAVELPSSAWDTIQFLYGTSAVPSVRDQRLADAIADGLYQIRFDIQVRNIANAVGPVVVTATAYSDTGGDAATATQTETLTLSASSASEDATVTLDIGTAMQSFSITADASGVAPHANGTLQIQAVNVRYIPLIKEVAKNAIDRDELAAPVRGALVESVATLPDVAGYSLGEKVYLEGTDGDNPAGFYILVAAGARRVWQQAVAAGGGGGTGGGAIALATRVAAFQIPVIATQNLDTTAADTPVAYTIPAFSGDSVAGVAQQSVVNGQGRITMLAAGVAEMIVEDELEIVSSNAGGAGADGFVEWGIAQFSADGTPLRQWIQNFAIQDQITRPISIAITVSTGIVPVANGDYFQFIIGFASASASARRLRFAFPTDEPLLQERVEIVLLRGATEGDTGAGVTEAQVNQLITASLTNYLTATQVQSALTTALTPYSTTSEIATSIATALTPYRTATQITALINAIRQVSTGGTTGQILTRQSGGGYGWADAPSGGGGQTASQVSAAITAALAQYRTITQITALINAVRQVSSGGTTGQILTKTATGYDWMNAPATGRTEAQVNTAIATALGPYSTTAQVTALINAVRQVSTGGTQGQILTRLTGNAYGWADAPSGGGGGLTQTQVLALIRANEDNQSYAIREALLNVLLQPVAGQASVTFTSVTAGTPENFDNRLQAAADDFIRLDFVQVNNNGDVTKTYDPIIAVREDILALTNSATVDTALTNAANYQSFPLKVNGVTQTENTIRLGRSGNSLLIAFGTTQAQAYRATIAGLDQRISGDEVLRVINKFADGAIEGRLISNPEIPYGTTLPAITGRRPGSVFVLEGDDSNVLQWLRPAESAAATNRNRVQIVVGQTDDAFVEWVDPIIGSAPDNFQDFVGGLRRIQERTTGGPNQYRYYLYLREGALSALGINTDTDGGTKFWATIRGTVRPFIREASDTTVPINGANYVEFKTAAGPGTTISPFTVGATENLLFWSNSGGSATINIKPATERNSEAWEALGGAAATDGGGGGGAGVEWEELLDYEPATTSATRNNSIQLPAFSRTLGSADDDFILSIGLTFHISNTAIRFPRNFPRNIRVENWRTLDELPDINYPDSNARQNRPLIYVGELETIAGTTVEIWIGKRQDRIVIVSSSNNPRVIKAEVSLQKITGGTGGGTGGPGITWTEILDYNPATAQQITANNNLLMAAFSRALTDADNDSVLQVIVTPANAADSQTFPRSVARYIKVSDYRDLSVSATNINYRVIGNRAATEALYLGALTVPQSDTAINIWMARTANDRINLYTDRNNAYIRSVKVRLMEFTGGGSGGTGGGTGTPAAFAQENLVDYTPTRKLAAGSSQIFRFRNAETARVTGLTAADDDNFLLVKILFSASTSASPNRSRRPFAFPRLIKVSDFRALADFGSGSLATRIDQPIINLGRYFYTDNDTGSVQVWIGKRQTDIGVITDNTTAVLQNITIDIVRVTGGGGGGGDAAVPSGATFPAMPALDDEFDLTAQQTVALPAFLTAGRSGLHMTGDIYGWDGTFGNIDRVGTGIDSILWYDNTSTNVLANRQRVTVGRVGNNSRTPRDITIGDTTYTLQRVSASSHFWRTTLAIASNPFSMRTQVQITYTDDSKEYPDEIYNPGRYQWNGLEWQKTSPLDGADVRQALQDLPAGERLNIRYIDGVQRSRYETIIYDQAAPTGINVTQTNRAVEGALQLLTPAFEMDVQNNGEIHVAAQIGVSTRGNNTLGFTADALQQVRITDILFLTELLNSAPYVVGGTVEGIRVGNPIDVYADSALQGQIEIRLARDALYQLGFVFRYTPGAGTANTNFAAGVHMSMSFSPTDDGNNGWRTLLDWTTNGASPPRIMNAYEVPAAQAFPVPDIIRSGFMQMYISYGAASSHVLVDRIPAAVTTPLDWSAYRDLPNHTYVNRAQLQGYQIGRLLASSGVGGTQAWWVSKGPNGRLQLVTGNTTLYLYRLVVNSFTIA